ncbi:STAS domain-containing protein [Kibdelosporangium philippinense]|uniref:Anti-sigma factor antagonist n=1 Tax=Kibdelosporangium philippinense TaxID=211113 RepID=A0ABS8Z6F9_9PSEU|nr:STAS domain-containing protein [Kibdelosporangium philippinense]MCE7003077.1 STAS domain-containing protein [Kibdelosporangium philippinense]
MTDARPELTCDVNSDEQTTVVHIAGEIDISTQELFDEAVHAGLDGPSPLVILDLAEVTFLGSIGLRILILAHNEAESAARQLRIVEGSEAVKRVMAITGLAQILALYPTVEEARSA